MPDSNIRRLILIFLIRVVAMPEIWLRVVAMPEIWLRVVAMPEIWLGVVAMPDSNIRSTKIQK
jgi:hypothetical protein